MEKVRTVFFGSGEFAVPILRKLLETDFMDLTAVVTQPDKPAGRKQQLLPVPVKAFLTDNYPDTKTYQPVLYRKVQTEILESEKPELIIVADYGQILPRETIDYPKHKSLNIHGSILPDLRGAVPIPVSILRGYEKTGVSILVMTTGLDDGPVLAMKERKIEPDDSTTSLKAKLAQDGAELLVEILPAWILGELSPIAQDESKATLADKSLIDKERARFDIKTSSTELDRMIRAFNPWPVAWCEVIVNNQKKRLKIYSAKIIGNHETSSPGVIRKSEEGIQLVLGNGVLELTELQLEGKTIGKGKDYRYLDGGEIV